jgi:hypothetical protein
MTFLPIVERELRVAARRKSTYRFRLFAAIGAIGIVGLLLLMAETLAAAGKYGGLVFNALAWLSFSYCLLDGARNTADCLSEEKRAGTLGLLFLTDLRPYDVVLGKLMATSLNSFYGLLAIFPPLAIPLVIGGVTVGEFWRLVLVLMNTLFFSVAAGLAVSAASRDERRAWSATVGLIVLFAVVPPVLLLKASWASSVLATLSPTTGFLNVFDAAYSTTPDRYWSSFRCVQMLSWSFLLVAVLVLPRAWQDRPLAATGSWWRRMAGAGARPAAVDDFTSRSLLLDGNPIVWLVTRGRERQTTLWLLVILAGAVATFAWVLASGAMAVAGAVFGVMFLVHLTVAIWVTSEACHAFAGARDSGALELLLCTPLTAKEVVEGHVLGLRRMFYRPVAVLLSVEGFLLGGQVLLMGLSGAQFRDCALVVFVVALCLGAAVLDLPAVARYGLWQGLLQRKPAKAINRTVMFVLVIPLATALVCTGGILLPLIWPLKNLVFINYARDQLRRQFRALLTERFGWAEQSEMVGQPAPRARAHQLPPVLPR